jgi:hypothetical protein
MTNNQCSQSLKISPVVEMTNNQCSQSLKISPVVEMTNNQCSQSIKISPVGLPDKKKSKLQDFSRWPA